MYHFDTFIVLLGNYLSDRCQYVEYNGHRSNTLPITTGVPQGSFGVITISYRYQ